VQRRSRESLSFRISKWKGSFETCSTPTILSGFFVDRTAIANEPPSLFTVSRTASVKFVYDGGLSTPELLNNVLISSQSAMMSLLLFHHSSNGGGLLNVGSISLYCLLAITSGEVTL
jgi:hypothetical protein